MERFAFKIDKTLRANLYKICRLCGIDNPDKVNILVNPENIVNVDDCEPELCRKIQDCIGLTITKDDKMPQTMCTLCVDKINDFFEFREMCFATNLQTRKLLGLKQELPVKPASIKPELDIKTALLPSTQLSKRPLISAKRNRKRKSEEILSKTEIKKDVDEIKLEKATTSTVGTPLRKKQKLSVSNNIIPVTSSVSAAAATTVAASPTTSQKKQKPLTPMQRRAQEQTEKKLKPKEEM